jgi:hypothetical protein
MSMWKSQVLMARALLTEVVFLTLLIVCRKNLSQSDLMDCKIVSIEGAEKIFWWGARIVVNMSYLTNYGQKKVHK